MKISSHVLGVRLDPSSSKSFAVNAALVFSKLLKSFGLYLLFDHLSQYSLINSVWLLSALSASIFVILQRPFSRKPALSGKQIGRVTVCGALHALEQFLYAFGLLLCAPVRTILLGDFSHVALLGTANLLLSAGSAAASRVRGAICSLGALLLIVVGDDATGAHTIVHEESSGSHEDYHTVRHSKYFGWLMVSDHLVGVLILLVAACVRVARQRLVKILGNDLGGVKRVQALSMTFATVWLAPFAVMAWLTELSVGLELSFDALTTLSFIALLVVVVDFYVDRAASDALDPALVVSLGMVAAFSGAAVLGYLQGHEVVTGGTVLSFFLLFFGTRQLSQRQAAPAVPIGYAPDGLPLYHTLQQPALPLMESMRTVMRAILDNRDTKQIFMFLSINFAFMLVEFSYGIWSNSLGLVSDAFHMLFDCSALMVGLYAAVMAKWKPTRLFSYGYSRVEVLSGFANGVFLVVIAISVFFKSISRLHSPPHLHTDRLMLVSAGGLLVNFIGIFAFSHAHQASHGGGGCSHDHQHTHEHDHAHGNEGGRKKKRSFLDRLLAPVNANMQGVFLHILADTLGSVGVLTSSILVEQFGWLAADPLCSLFISILIFISVIPLLSQSSSVLLLSSPPDRVEALVNAFTEIRRLEGVVGYQDPRVWTHTNETIMASVRIIVAQGTSEQRVLVQATGFLKAAGVTQPCVQVESEVVAAKRSLKAGSSEHVAYSTVFSDIAFAITSV